MYTLRHLRELLRASRHLEINIDGSVSDSCSSPRLVDLDLGDGWVVTRLTSGRVLVIAITSHSGGHGLGVRVVSGRRVCSWVATGVDIRGRAAGISVTTGSTTISSVVIRRDLGLATGGSAGRREGQL